VCQASLHVCEISNILFKNREVLLKMAIEKHRADVLMSILLRGFHQRKVFQKLNTEHPEYFPKHRDARGEPLNIRSRRFLILFKREGCGPSPCCPSRRIKQGWWSIAKGLLRTLASQCRCRRGMDNFKGMMYDTHATRNRAPCIRKRSPQFKNQGSRAKKTTDGVGPSNTWPASRLSYYPYVLR